MAVIYLEADDEITGAIARIRAVKDGEAIIVVPPGSRIASSRINFKLLARAGNERRLNIVAVSDEPSARALAISAGLPAYDSLPAAENALSTFREQDRRLAERLGRQPTAAEVARARPPATEPRKSDTSDQTQVMPIPAGPHAGPRAGPRAARKPPPSSSDVASEEPPIWRRIGPLPLIGAGVLLLLLAGVGYGAYVLLPTATITLTSATTPLTAAPVTVVADPDVAVTDPANGVVPAQRLQIPLTVHATFPATGTQTRETRATGTVRFRSENTLNEVAVLEGTVVSTADGKEFETTQAAIVPRADFSTGTPGTIDVPIRAVTGGPDGNVPADVITVEPPALSGQLVSVRNPGPTRGGRRIDEKVVQQSDYDAAAVALDGMLESALAAKLNDPNTPPAGLTIFFTSAQTGVAVIQPPVADAVGTVAETIDLTMTSTATVTAVNLALVDGLAVDTITSTLLPTQRIVESSLQTSHSEGSVIGERVTFTVTTTGATYVEPDRSALAAAVRGKSIPEARRILEPYGMVEISIWPGFVDRLPDQTSRISLVVVTPSAQP